MLVVSEGLARDTDTTSQKLLVDLGVNVAAVGSHNIAKKAPHEKYYWFKYKISFNTNHLYKIIEMHNSKMLKINALNISIYVSYPIYNNAFILHFLDPLFGFNS